MAEPKRTLEQRERDLVSIAEWYCKGEAQALIAVKLQLSQQQISYDLVEIRKRWRASALVNYDEAMGKELARLDMVESQAWNAWDASKRTVRKTRTKTMPVIQAESAGDDGPFTAQLVQTAEFTEMLEESVGDPRYLAVILQCIEKRGNILGLNNPKKQAGDLLGENAKEHIIRLEQGNEQNARSIIALVREIEGSARDTATENE